MGYKFNGEYFCMLFKHLWHTLYLFIYLRKKNISPYFSGVVDIPISILCGTLGNNCWCETDVGDTFLAESSCTITTTGTVSVSVES